MKHLCIEECKGMYPVGIELPAAEEYIDKVVEVLNPHIKDMDVCLWVRGSSGVFLSTLLYSRVKNICQKFVVNHVKKEGEHSHYEGCEIVEGSHAINIILDDFSFSGATINHIYDKLIKCVPTELPIDFLILARMHPCGEGGSFPFKFIPKYVITDKVSYCSDWDKIETKEDNIKLILEYEKTTIKNSKRRLEDVQANLYGFFLP